MHKNNIQENELRTMITAAKKAAKIVMKLYKKNIKTINNPDKLVTEADKESNKIIIKELRSGCPDYPILSEESTDDLTRLDARQIFIVDPLDGTDRFLNHSDDFAINIALVKNGRPIVGVISLPARDIIISACKGLGTKKTVGTSESLLPLHTSSNNINDLHLSYSESSRKKSERFNNIINSLPATNPHDPRGSVGYKMAQIAMGEKDAYFRMGTKCSDWDVCAGDIVISEAGGKVTDFNGKELKYNSANTEKNDFLTSNRATHRHLLRHIKSHL